MRLYCRDCGEANAECVYAEIDCESEREASEAGWY